jgi:transposase
MADPADVTEREVRDLPWGKFRTTVVIELYRVRCPDCGLKIEKVDQLPSKAPFSKRFEEAVGEACESASARRVAKQFGLAESTIRAIDLRYLERWNAQRTKPALRQMGVDEIYLGKTTKFVTVVSNLETGEPLWFGRERKKETLDEFFRTQLSRRQRHRIEAACVDMWEPFKISIQEWSPNCAIVYDKFHIMQHANQAVDEVRRAEFFRKGARMRGVVKGKRWLLLTRWVHLTANKRQQLNQLFALNRRLMKAYLLKELDTATTVAATARLREVGAPADRSPGRHPKLLPRQGSLRCGGSDQRQHQSPVATRPWVQKSTLPAAQGAAYGCHQN